MLISIAGAIVTMGLKFAGYFITDSVGLFSDAAESIVNLLASLLALIALTIASRPPDKSHTFGHEKAEYFSSGAEGMLIIVAAVGILYSAINRLLYPRPLTNLDVGLMIVAIAAVVNLAIALFLLRAAKNFDSITLEADAKHLLTDVFTSAGVIGGLIVANLTGWQFLDPLLALGIGLNIIFTGISLMQRSTQGLMDYRLPEKELKFIEGILEKKHQQMVGYHNLRTRKSGSKRFVEFHLLVSGEMAVQQAHNLCEEVEAAIRSKLDHCEIIIHVEPSEDALSWDVQTQAGGRIFGTKDFLSKTNRLKN